MNDCLYMTNSLGDFKKKKIFTNLEGKLFSKVTYKNSHIKIHSKRFQRSIESIDVRKDLPARFIDGLIGLDNERKIFLND